MRKACRTAWSKTDYSAACQEFNRLDSQPRREQYKYDGRTLFLCAGRCKGMPVYWVENVAGKRQSKRFIGGRDRFEEVLNDVRNQPVEPNE